MSNELAIHHFRKVTELPANPNGDRYLLQQIALGLLELASVDPQPERIPCLNLSRAKKAFIRAKDIADYEDNHSVKYLALGLLYLVKMN